MNFLGSLKSYNNLENKQILKDTINIAWPSVLESFLTNLTGFLDSIMVGTLGISAIAAVGITVQPKFMVLAIFFGLSTAISSIVARRRGEGNRESANKVLKTGLVFSLIASVIICSLAVIFADPIIAFCGSKSDTHEMAVGYFIIISLGLIFNIISIVINAAQRGSGNTQISMTTNITANIVNVILNYLLIGGNLGFPKLGIYGAAIATVIGGFVACVMSIFSILRPSSYIYIGFCKGIWASKQDIKSTVDIGTSAFVDQIFLRIGFLLFAITVATLGTNEMGAHQIGINFMSISFAFADGLAVASVALVGRSLGQNAPDKAKKYANTCLILGIGCAIIISSILFFFGRTLFSLFDTTPQVLEYGDMIMSILCLVLYIQITQVTMIGCLRGAGDTKYTAFISLIAVAIVRPAFSWFLCFPCGLGLFGVWLGLCSDQLIRFTMGFIRYKKGNWLQIKI